jgi:hypothetical protein
MSDFSLSAPSANPVFYRTYSRKTSSGRESWQQVVERNLSGLAKLGKLTDEQVALLRRMQLEQKALPSGRWLWVGGTEWIKKPENVSGAYNCTSTDLVDWRAFALMMDLAMMGSGTGAIIEPHMIDMLPIIRNKLNVKVVGEFGDKPSDPETTFKFNPVAKPQHVELGKPLCNMLAPGIKIEVGDSRKGWVSAYWKMFDLVSNPFGVYWGGEINVTVDISKVRPSGEPLKGFGGTANPVKLKDLFIKMAAIFNKAHGRKLTSVECCLLIDEAALVVVAGNVRRSAGIRQFNANDTEASIAKDNLWQQDEDGNWRIDPERDALRMANHTLVYHNYPTREEIVDSVRRQFLSGEGAIMFAPEAIARSNCDILTARQMQNDFVSTYCEDKQSGAEMLKKLDPDCAKDNKKLDHRMGRYGINPCFAPGTMVMTRDGDYPIESLVGKTVEIHDGEKWVEIDNFRVTGVNQNVFTVFLSYGKTIKATEYHTFILANGERLQLKDLELGMRLKVNKTVDGMPHGLNRVKAAKIVSIRHSGVSEKVYCCTVPDSHRFTLSNGVIVGQCGEISGKNFHCNLAEVHLNQILPADRLGQKEAFTAAGLSVAALLHHKFQESRYQYSRDLDPIVGVSFTGLFDFFVEAFGVAWLQWWEAGRPNTDVGLAFKDAEAKYLNSWREIVEETIQKYCDRHALKCPNRMTTVQPAGTKSLLTGASPGWHPPKAQRFIRRITFRRDDPVALACLDYGYNIVPGQGDKDDEGRLLDDPFDPRCTEWLIEIPTEVTWANVPGADKIKIDQFSALAQFDFYMQIQTHYTRHNTSATIEFREHEIEPLANKIYDAIVDHKGYISAALLARFDANETFPRLPFEPISKATYDRLHDEVLQRRKGDDFFTLLQAYDVGSLVEAGPAGCDSDKCLLPQVKQ